MGMRAHDVRAAAMRQRKSKASCTAAISVRVRPLARKVVAWA